MAAALLLSLILEVPPLVSQPLSSLSLAFRHGLCLSVCFVHETTGHGTNTTFRGRRVDPEFGPLRSRAWGRRLCCCRLLYCAVVLLGVVCVVGEGTTPWPWGREPALLPHFLVPPSFLFF